MNPDSQRLKRIRSLTTESCYDIAAGQHPEVANVAGAY